MLVVEVDTTPRCIAIQFFKTCFMPVYHRMLDATTRCCLLRVSAFFASLR
jgi:hypothetical protein